MIDLDSCLLIYAVEEHPIFAKTVVAALVRHADEVMALSALSRLECLVAPIRDANLVLQRHYEAAFDALQSLPIDDAVWQLATDLRARHGLRRPTRCIWPAPSAMVAAGCGRTTSGLRTWQPVSR